MTNTKFRKRALLSAVAMLLVALVALGSATFAWYQAKVDVDVAGMKMTTTAAPGLLVATKSDMGGAWNSTYAGWDGTANLASKDTATSLQPASYDQTNNKFYTITAAGPTEKTAAAGQAVVTTTNYISDVVYFKLDEGTATGSEKVYLKSVALNKNTAGGAKQSIINDLYPAVRVVVTKADGTFIGEYAPSAIASEDYYIMNATDSSKGDRNTAGSEKSIAAAGPVSNKECCSVGAAAEANSVVVYVYLDGEGTNVYTNKAKTLADAAAILDSLSLNFSLVD